MKGKWTTACCALPSLPPGRGAVGLLPPSGPGDDGDAGGHHEAGESILQTAERELHEETGARSFSLKPVLVYGVTGKNRVNLTGRETFGMLFFAEVEAFESALHHEMEQVMLCHEPPQLWTYPQIQPALLREVCARLGYEFGSFGD